VSDLLRDSATFARLWNSHAVVGREGGARSLNHPTRGVVQLNQITLAPSAYPDHKVVVLLNAPAKLAATSGTQNKK